MLLLGRRIRVLLVALVIFAVAVPAGEALGQPGSGGPTAGVAKKKHKKRRKRCKKVKVRRHGKLVVKKKCKSKKKKRNAGAPGPGGQNQNQTQAGDPKATAQQLIADNEFYRPFAGQYTSGEETWRFCSPNTLFYRYTSQGQYSTSENYGNGSWQVTDAKQGNVAGYDVIEATVAINANFTDVGAKQGNIIVDVSPQTSRAYINAGSGSNEFVRRARQGGC